MNLIDQAFGIHPQALSLRSQRSSVIAGNIANADTPDFKARDFDFKAVLKDAQGNMKTSFARTHSRHIPLNDGPNDSTLMYRVPTKQAGNGNTVESEVEQSAFAENALRYQTSLEFLSGTIRGMKLAIKGQ